MRIDPRLAIDSPDWEGEVQRATAAVLKVLSAGGDDYFIRLRDGRLAP